MSAPKTTNQVDQMLQRLERLEAHVERMIGFRSFIGHQLVGEGESAPVAGSTASYGEDRRPDDAGALPAPPPWFNLDALVDEDTQAELHHLADEVEALEAAFVDQLAARCFRVLKTIDGVPINPDTTFGELHELMRQASGAERLDDALHRLSEHAGVAAGERPEHELEWLTPLLAEFGIDDCGLPVGRPTTGGS